MRSFRTSSFPGKAARLLLCAFPLAGALAASQATPARAASGGEIGAERRVGIGFEVGEPTGLSGKYWLGHNVAVDAGAAWSFVDPTAFDLHVDYVVHDFSILHPDEGRAAIYYGMGGRVKFSARDRLGLRGVGGLDYLFAGAPVDAFVELAPILDLAPRTDFSLAGGIGVRMFFGPSWQ